MSAYAIRLSLVTALALAWSATLAAEGGLASWYGAAHAGRPMANGRPFNPQALTCASWFHPLGARLRVSHGNRSVVVTVTDRGPAWRLVRQGRKVDLSRAAFACLAPLGKGLVAVEIQPAERKKAKGKRQKAATASLLLPFAFYLLPSREVFCVR